VRSLAWRRLAIVATLLGLGSPKRLTLELDPLAKAGIAHSWRRVAAFAIELPEAPVAEVERAGAP
jgi:hypothetical protein